MQSCGGARPGGLVATEFQEWLRLRCIPGIRQFCKANFKERGHPPWFSWSAYQRLCGALDRTPSGMEPNFLLSLDADARHTMKHMWPEIDHPTPRGMRAPPPADRRLIPAGEEGHIPLHPVYSYAPSAPRIPDVLQFPIESTFSTVKRAFRAELRACKAPSPRQMVAAMQAGFARGATQPSIEQRFVHAEKNMLVFSGQEGSVVELDGVRYHCTGGNWLPAVLRG